MGAWGCIFVVALVGLGCSAAGAEADPSAAAGELALEAPAQAEPAPHACERTFSPGPGAEELVADAAAAWSEATGCDIHVADGGIPVRLVAGIVNAKGEPQCGVTHRQRDASGQIVGVSGIEISVNTADRCRDPARATKHEMGHALAPRSTHTTEGLMAPVPEGTDYVDGIAAAFVCAELLG